MAARTDRRKLWSIALGTCLLVLFAALRFGAGVFQSMLISSAHRFNAGTCWKTSFMLTVIGIARIRPIRPHRYPPKRPAIRTMLGSLKPANASLIVMTPVNGMITIMSSATASIRGRLAMNIAIAAASSSRTKARLVFMRDHF